MNIILQHVVFPKKSICNEKNLYYRDIGFPTMKKIVDNKAYFNNKQRTNFDTYFNSFSLAKWLKYTKVTNLKLHVVASGSFKIGIFHYYILNDAVKYDFYEEKEINSDKVEDLYLEYKLENSDIMYGMYSFGVYCGRNDSVIHSITYETEIDEADVSYVKVGIGTCTYKRENYIISNMKMLCDSFLENKESELYNGLEVFISDNAKTLSDVKWPSKKIHYFENKNTGGSGGFTRTMMEVINANERGESFTHILLMDDDLTYEPEAIYRTYRILTLLKEEYKDSFVCGSMMRTDNQTIQHEAGCHWGKGIIISYKHNFDLAWPRQCCDNEYDDDYQYFGWWFCTMPMSTVRKDNLPLPMFIKIDDAEYGIRNLTNAIYLNGICVWHEPFEFKFTPTSAYYIARNSLICNATHGIYLSLDEAIQQLKDYYNSVIPNLRYLCFDLFCEGVIDYLKGVEWIKQNDLEKLHKELMGRCDDYKYMPLEELSIWYDEDNFNRTRDLNRNIIKRISRFISKITVNGLFVPSRKVVITDTSRYLPRALFAAKKVLVVEKNSNKGFVLERSIKKYIKCRHELNKTIKLLKKKYYKVNGEYRSHAKEMMTYDFWRTKLEDK